MSKIGIALAGCYLPTFRVERDVIARNWERGSLGGERTVANNDEDAITMAVEASRNCLRGKERGDLDGLFFATTSAPYQEKLNASLIAAALDSRREFFTADFGFSLRAGTAALKAALDAVAGGSGKKVLVTAADCRLGYPRSDQEQIFGDGAAAVLVSREDPWATFEGSYSICNEMHDVWRNPEDRFVRTWESRFILTEGYTNHMVEAVRGLLKKNNLEAKDVSKAIFPAPDMRTHKGLVQKLGFDFKTQVQDPLIQSVGHCGAAQALIMLVKALEEAGPGELLLLANYADGADALIFRTTDRIAQAQQQKKIQAFLNQKLMLTSYARFLSYKGLVEAVPGEPFRLFPSATVTWRDRNSVLRCHASKCRECGTMTFPVQRICVHCQSKDRFDEVPISESEGEIFTFTLDNLAGRSDDPVVVQAVADMAKEKARFYGMLTDCVPSQVKVGMPVGFTFRRIYDGMGIHNYFWKLRPLARNL